MFGKKKENEASEPTISDLFYLVSLIAEKAGIDLGSGEEVEEETATTDKVEENAVVDTEKFFEEERQEGDHDDSIKENEDHTDKRKLIDEIGGILKGKVDDELWRTIIGKAEKIAYEGSETSSKDNSCKNEVEDKEDKSKEKKQEDKQKETGDDELKKDAEKRPIFNSIMQSLRQPVKSSYLTRNERIAEANKKYSLN